MRLFTGLFAVVLALTALVQTSAAQTAAPKPAGDRAAIEKQLMAIEQKLNDAVMKGDLAGFKSMAAADVMAVDENGTMGMAELTPMMKPGMAKVTNMALTGFKVQWIDANNVVLTYAWTGKGTMMGMPVKPTYASTLYNKRGDKWLAVFHQESVQAPPAPAAKK